MSDPTENFISAAYEDMSHLEKKAYLEALKRQGLIQTWHDAAINPGVKLAPGSKGFRIPWAYLILTVILLLTSTGCGTRQPYSPVTATPTPKNPLDVYVGELKAPFKVDANTSPDKLHGWYTRTQGVLSVTYPPLQSWGTISITVGKPVPLSDRHNSLDLSAYHSLVFDMRLVTGEPYVRVGIKDWEQCDDGSEITVRQLLTPQWTTVALPLNTFTNVDLAHVYAAFEVNFQGTSSTTVDLRNIRYLPDTAVLPPPPPILPPFNVYTDWGDPENHYVPSGWMGTAIDASTNNNQSSCNPAPISNSDITLTENWTENPHSGKTCIRVVFHAATPPDQNWAGVYWQDPVDNWGKTLGPTGYDLSHVSKLSFWVRGAVGGEQIDFLVGGITQDRDGNPLPNPDTATEETGYITLTTSWQQVFIPLTGDDLSHIIGGFAWVTNNSYNPNGATFYLDDIIFVQ